MGCERRLMAIEIEIIDCRWISTSVEENRLVSLERFVIPPLVVDNKAQEHIQPVEPSREAVDAEQDLVAESSSSSSLAITRLSRLTIALQ